MIAASQSSTNAWWKPWTSTNAAPPVKKTTNLPEYLNSHKAIMNDLSR